MIIDRKHRDEGAQGRRHRLEVETLNRWREQYGELDPADHEIWWAAMALDVYLLDVEGEQEG